MPHLTIARGAANLPALDAELRAALGDLALGVSAGPGGLTLHLRDDALPEHAAAARALALAHDPARLTPQQAAVKQRRDQLDTLRRDHSTPLDLSAYQGKETLLARLAARIAWLEQEIAELRGG